MPSLWLAPRCGRPASPPTRANGKICYCQRFNFLLIANSLFVSAAAAAPVARLRLAVLIAGSLVTLMVALTIWRAYVKLIINVRMLYRIADHPLTMVNLETEKLSGPALIPVNFIIAFWIPVLCVLSLAFGALLTSYGVFDPLPPR